LKQEATSRPAGIQNQKTKAWWLSVVETNIQEAKIKNLKLGG